MRDTRGRYPVFTRVSGWGKHWQLILLAVLLLAACDSQGNDAPPSPEEEQATVVVSTVVPTAEAVQASATIPPTVVVPTITPTATPPAPLAAMVNGQYVFLADYERQVAQYEQALLELGLDPNSTEGQARLAQSRQDVLDGLIDDILIEQGSTALGVSVSEEELEAQVEADVAEGGGQAAFDEWLQATGQTREDYKRMLRQAMISQRVWDIVTADVPEVTEQVHAREIVVDSEEAAQQILAWLEEGVDFVTLAREHSLDLATKDNGGDLGWFPRGLIAIELENAAFVLQPGEVSQAILLGERFHLVQVMEREVERPLSPEMRMLLMQNTFERWLEEQRTAATIERFVGE
jgi:parvulin-like peptidyl-prolyl isomerase